MVELTDRIIAVSYTHLSVFVKWRICLNIKICRIQIPKVIQERSNIIMLYIKREYKEMLNKVNQINHTNASRVH